MVSFLITVAIVAALISIYSTASENGFGGVFLVIALVLLGVACIVDYNSEPTYTTYIVKVETNNG